MTRDKRLIAWYQGWAVTRKGSGTSGNWGHKGRPGMRGGSLPGGGMGALGLSSDAPRWDRERATNKQRQSTKEKHRPKGQIRSEDVHTIKDAQRWFASRGMEADLVGVTNVDAVKESIQAIEDALERHPWMTERIGPLDYKGGSYDIEHAKGKEYRFLGVSTYEGKDVPGKVVDLSGDAFAMTEARGTLVRDLGGPVIYYSSKGLNSGKGSELYSQVGIVAKPNGTVYGATTHEMGHAIWDVAASRGRISQHTGQPMWGRTGEAHRIAMHDAGITERMLKKNVSWYATTDPREAFAEMYLVLRSTMEQAPTSKAFRAKLGKWAASINDQFGWEVL